MTLWDRSQKDKALTHAYVTLFLMWWTALLTARAVCGDFVNSPASDFHRSSNWCYTPEFSVINQQHPRQPISTGEKNSPVEHKQELQRK
jgi:hypothetical protein